MPHVLPRYKQWTKPLFISLLFFFIACLPLIWSSSMFYQCLTTSWHQASFFFFLFAWSILYLLAFIPMLEHTWFHTRIPPPLGLIVPRSFLDHLRCIFEQWSSLSGLVNISHMMALRVTLAGCTCAFHSVQTDSEQSICLVCFRRFGFDLAYSCSGLASPSWYQHASHHLSTS